MYSQRLEELRTDKGLTKKEVAKILGIHESTYGKYELGKREPDFDMFNRLAQYYDVSADYLLGRSDVPNPKNDPQFSFNTNFNQLNPLTGKKMTSREKTQYREVMENAAHALFFDEAISERDKELFFESVTEAFWEAKRLNRRKPISTET